MIIQLHKAISSSVSCPAFSIAIRKKMWTSVYLFNYGAAFILNSPWTAQQTTREIEIRVAQCLTVDFRIVVL